MAKCEYCGKEMLTADGCTFQILLLETRAGTTRRLRRYKVGENDWTEPGERCNDCGAKYGHYHHFGCDNEQCPECGMQLISCDCPMHALAKETSKSKRT